MCVCLRCGKVSSFVLCFVPAVVIVSLSAMIAGWSSSDHRTWRAEGVGRLRKPPALEPSTHSCPETPISRFQAAPFPPARIATAHWAARDHPHLDLFMQAHELFAHRRNTTIILHHQSATSGPALFINFAIDSFAFFLFLSPCTNCNHFTNNVEPPLGRLVNITLTHLVAS
jgi:hypothetical protein